MTGRIIDRLKNFAGLLLSFALLLGIIYMILVTIGIYMNALNYRIEPFYTAYLLFYNFDRTLSSLRISVYLFYVFFTLTLVAPIIVLVKELRVNRKGTTRKEET